MYAPTVWIGLPPHSTCPSCNAEASGSRLVTWLFVTDSEARFGNFESGSSDDTCAFEILMYNSLVRAASGSNDVIGLSGQ